MNSNNLRKIDLIAIDLDGTLLTTDRKIHPENIVAIKDALEAGVWVVLSSGRIRPSMVPFAAELGISHGPFICSNGAHIVLPNGEHLERLFLHAQDRDEIISFSLREKLHLHAYSTDHMFFTEEDGWSEMYRQRAKTIPATLVGREELHAMDFIKMMVIAEPERIQEIIPVAKASFAADRLALTESEPEYLEFLPARASKGAALAKLSAQLHVPQAGVMAIGDYLNDLEMIQWAGTGVAMGNAVDAVKTAANVIAPTNDAGGVAWAIRSVLQ